MPTFEVIAQTTLALFTIVDPIGSIPLFLELTDGQSPPSRRKTALVATFAAFVTLLISLLGGRAILDLFHVSIPAFTLAGSAIIATIAWSMLNVSTTPIRQTDEEKRDAATHDDVAVVPLAIPILAGPGAISTVIQFSNHQNVSVDLGEVVAIAIVSISTGAFFAAAPAVQRVLGLNGMHVMTRLFGLLLLAIAVNGAAQALRVLFPGLAPH